MNPVLPLSLLIPLLVIVMIGGAWLSLKSSESASSGLRRWLLAMRLLAFLALAVFLLNPGKWQQATDQAVRIWAVLIDDSASMSIADGEEKKTRIQKADDVKKTISKSAADAGVEVEFFSYDQSLRSLNDENSLRAQGEGSDLSSAADSLLTQMSSQGKPLSGALVVTDGRQTHVPRHSSFALRAQALQVPFHGVLLGGNHVMNDLSLEVPKKMVTAFPSQTVQLTAMIQSQGMDPLETQLDLINAAGDSLGTAKLKIKPNDRAIHTFSFKAPEESTTLMLKIPDHDGDLRLSNNKAEVQLRILHDKARVFIAEGSPYWDSKFLAQLLRQQKHMEVHSVHRLSDTRWFRIDTGESKPHESNVDVFPGTKEELMAYDLIIFGKNSEHFLTPERIANLRAFVKDQGGAVLFSRSKPYTGMMPDLEALEPVTWKTGITGNFKLRPSADGQAAGLFGQALPAPDSSVWAGLPELKDAHRIDIIKPFTRVLAHGEVGSESTRGRFPLLLIRRYGQGVSGLVNADGLWKWDFFPDARELGNMYQEFWIQMIHWMLSYSEFLPGQNYSLSVSAGTVKPDTPIAVHVAYRGTGKPKLPRVEIHSTALDEPIRLAPAVVPTADGRLKWGGSFTPDKPGNYQLRILPDTAPKEGTSLPEASVTVLPPPGEMDELSADREFLTDFCESSGGQLIESQNLTSFLTNAMKPTAPESRDRGVEWKSYWIRWFIPIIVLLLLATEWWLRRRNGLV